MNLNLQNITFIIVSFKSENVIYDCINSLPQNSNKIIIENSKNVKLKKDLETKYDNIEVLLSENLGMGASNNIGIKRANTEFVFVINPDVKFKKDTFENLVISSKKIEDFAILSPMHNQSNFPNYKGGKNFLDKDQNIISVDSIDGFSMLINKEKFKNHIFFDENIFLYLENDDLCFKVKERGENIYIIKNSLIEHLGGSSVHLNKTNNIEYLRNWHWMWSKFYFNKKHYGFLKAFVNIFFNIFSANIKYIFYLITFNTHKKEIYKMRLFGAINSIIGNNSFFRLDD
ncbi:glycosyltransferase [Candidatus Pelagibacter sp. Uisw_099_02]|uniref:glycosyltransferase family 2 protein n=1 Tax=Candidatus Pelagibacter sp. Uisw_099_02 TaxID=3230981 RepID=UPI0039E749EF